MKIVKKIFLFIIIFFVGILTVNAESKNIKVTDVTVKEKSTTIEVADPVISENEITSNITFNQVNDYVTFELTLKNNESEKYKITSITDNNTSNNIEVEYDYSEDFISSNDETKVKVKLTYKNKLTNSNISLDNLTITFNVENASGDTGQIVLNPNTGDNILHFLVLLIIAITGLILIVRKKKVKIGALVLAIGLIIIPFAVLAEEKFELNFKFSNIEVKGEFESYNVTIDKGNGTEPTTLSITYGEKIGELPDAPAKEGHTFVGWIDEENREVTEDTVITGPINITPVYSKDKHTLTITHPEYLSEGDVSGQYEYGTQVTLTATARDGFTFSKWSDNSTENPRTVTIGTSDIAIEPIYINSSYTISFDPKEGNVIIESMKVNQGETIQSFPTANREGYDFVGWYIGDNKIETPYTPEEDITLTAHYEESNELVKYTDSDSSGDISLGDYIKIGNDGFWVIGKESDNIKLLAEYNLDINSRQVSGNGYHELPFSEMRYWTECIYSAASSSSNSSSDSQEEFCDNFAYYNYSQDSEGYYYVYRDSSDYDTDNNLVSYINNYRDYLMNDLEVTDIIDARLMSYGEAIETGCEEYNSNTCPEYVTNQKYWFGSVDYYTNNFVMGVTDEDRVLGDYYGNSYGIRPVIIIPESIITKYTVSFDSLGGTFVNPQKVGSGEQLGRLPSAKKEGLVLQGWYTNTNYTTRVTPNTIITEDVTYYAKWVEPSGITYIDMDNNGSISYDDKVIIGSDVFWVITPPENSKVKLITEYNLDSNSRQTSTNNYATPAFSNINYWCAFDNHTVKDKYLKDKYNYSYIYRTSTGEDTKNNLKKYINNYKDYLVSIGAIDIEDARLMSYEESIEAGCTPDKNSCKSHIGGPFYWLGSVYNDDWYSLNIWTVYGYGTFGLVKHGYSNSTSSYGKNGIRPLIEIPVDENWNEAYYVTYDAQNGTVPKNVLVNKNDSLHNLPTEPTKNDWIFDGWYMDTNYTTKVTEETVPTKNVTYYAKWRAQIKHIDLDNSGSISLGDRVTIATEGFRVISSPDNGKVKLLAEYNLNSLCRQESSNNYQKLNYSDTDFWNAESNLNAYDTYTLDNYTYTNIYRTSKGEDTENNLKIYVNNYKDYLISIGATYITDARIMYYDEATNTGCSHYVDNSCPQYFSNQYYWLGTASSESTVFNIMSFDNSYQRVIGNFGYWYGVSYKVGVRPLIIINESAFTN